MITGNRNQRIPWTDSRLLGDPSGQNVLEYPAWPIRICHQRAKAGIDTATWLDLG